MSDKPKIYGFCNAGCKWETIHRSEYEALANQILVTPDSYGDYQLEFGQEYRIYSDGYSADKSIWNATIRFGENRFDTSFSLSHPRRNDKYSDNFFFKVISCTLNSSESGYDVIYEIEGRRVSEYYTKNNYGAYQVFVSGASKVYKIGNDAYIEAKGQDGEDGKDGDSVFIRYSANENGANFTSDWTAGQNYIGVATGKTAPTYKEAYEWSMFIYDSSEAATAAEQARIQAQQAATAAAQSAEVVSAFSGELTIVNTSTELLQAVSTGAPVIQLTSGANITMSQKVSLPAGTTLLGNGATITRATGHEGILFELLENCRVSNLKIDGNRTAMVSPTWSSTIDISARNNCVIEQVTIENANEGIICYGDDILVKNCVLSNCGGNGIHFSGANRVRVEGCKVLGANKRSGMGHENGCIIWSNECDYIDCVNNYCEDGLTGFGSIDADYNSYIKIIGNTVKNCTFAVKGHYTKESTYPHHITISDNHFIDSNEIRIAVSSDVNVSEKLTINDNIFENTIIYIKGFSKLIIDGNTIHCKFNSDIFAMALAYCAGVVISNNYIINNKAGMYITGSSDIQCSNNIIITNFYNISIDSNCNNCVIDGNIIKSFDYEANDSDNFMIRSADHSTVVNNKIIGFQNNGIMAGNGCLCDGNTIMLYEATGVSIRVYGGAKDYIVTKNMSNTSFGIATSANAIIENNLMTGDNGFCTVTADLMGFEFLVPINESYSGERAIPAIIGNSFEAELYCNTGYPENLNDIIIMDSNGTQLTKDIDYTITFDSNSICYLKIKYLTGDVSMFFPVSFIVGSISCVCPRGYTWKQFFDSDYSNAVKEKGDYTIYNGYVCYQGSGNYYSEDEIIIDGTSI